MIRHDYDWSAAPAPWNELGPEIVEAVKRVIGPSAHLSKPLKIGALPPGPVKPWSSDRVAKRHPSWRGFAE